MSAPAQPKATVPDAVSMSGAEKVAVLLLALGKPRAAKVLKRFDSEDLKILTQLAGDLAPIDASDLEGMVEEFAQKFSSGINFVGTEREVKNMLSDVMSEDQLAGVMSDEQEEPGEAPERVWDKISRIKDEALRAYLGKEHPQTAAMILSRVDPGLAAKIVAPFPAQQRNALLIRMLSIKKVADDAARAVELAIAEDLLSKSSSGSHAGIADILNRDGWRTWEGKPFNLKKIAFIRHAHKLASRYERLRRRGMLTTREVAAKFGISETAVHDWGRQGLITKCYSDNLNRGLWTLPAQHTIFRGRGGRGARPARLVPITAPSSGQGAV